MNFDECMKATINDSVVKRHSTLHKLVAFLMFYFKELAHVTVEKLIRSYLRHPVASHNFHM